ncbi:hypothetical protein C7444_105168 [Sphaerotilus hippei]|uniref:Transposase n=1 Tax=Sphaerotilus hippei TaxID=744406 RepID=A0A318H2P9_9BURK|nr:hypothetical protein C7444_105168 [Sphaerotilus hippei]
MARYGKEYKDRVVARLLPPESASVERVSAEVGVSASTLERWLAEALESASGGGDCPRGTPAGSTDLCVLRQCPHTPWYSRYSCTSAFTCAGTSNTWCRIGRPAATGPPHSHTSGGGQSWTASTSDSASSVRYVPLCPGCAPLARPLARRCALLPPESGPSDDGGFDELREFSFLSSSALTCSRSCASSCPNCSITAWHCSSVSGLSCTAAALRSGASGWSIHALSALLALRATRTSPA